MKYRPSCGSEGAAFIAAWCCNCERDKNEDCSILAATFAFDVDDPSYPPEWCYDEAADSLANSPRCTAFVPLGDPLPTPRCDATPDMFAEAKPATDGGDGR